MNGADNARYLVARLLNTAAARMPNGLWGIRESYTILPFDQREIIPFDPIHSTNDAIELALKTNMSVTIDHNCVTATLGKTKVKRKYYYPESRKRQFEICETIVGCAADEQHRRELEMTIVTHSHDLTETPKPNLDKKTPFMERLKALFG